MSEERGCSTHPDAPHGFNRNVSHNADRYVCDCEGWEPEDKNMNLEEALKLYDKAKEQGLVGEWPKALICVVEDAIEGNKLIKLLHLEVEHLQEAILKRDDIR